MQQGVSVAMVLLPKPLIAGLVSVSARFQEPQRFGEWEDYINLKREHPKTIGKYIDMYIMRGFILIDLAVS